MTEAVSFLRRVAFLAGLTASWLLSARIAGANSAQTYLEALVDFQRYGDTIWREAAHANAPAAAGYFGDGKSAGNGGIRGSCGVAVAYAALVRAFPSDPARPARLAKVRQALLYAANTHVSGAGRCVDQLQWGHDWQTAMWAGSMGLACLLVEADLPPDTVEAVRRALADEAAYRAGIPPASGFAGDTKAEENGWDGNVLALAAAWLAADPRVPLWREAAKSYLANTYTVADTSGDPLAGWISTVTLYPDFSLENHGFYHPSYQMVAGMSLGDSWLMARLASPAMAAELQPFAEHNVLNVWSNLNQMMLDSGELAHPAGLDWELHSFEHNSYLAWIASHFNDPLARWADDRIARLTRYRQQVNGDGRFVGPSGGGFYREAVEARRTAIAWLHWQHADFPAGAAAAPGISFTHLKAVRVIAGRGPFGFVSLSYGSRIMALVEPPAQSVPAHAFLTTPRLPGILGLGALGNPTGARLVSLSGNEGGFQAELELTNGVKGLTRTYVHCAGPGVAIVEVPWPAEGVSGLPSSSFTAGVENDPLTGPGRLLEWAGGSTVVTNRSGVTHDLASGWVCIAERHGLAAGPAGFFRYQAAASYNRSGAAEDSLSFVAAEPLNARYAVWFPGCDAAQTRANAGRITWTATATHVILQFPGPGGGLAQITAPLPPAGPAYPPYQLPVSSVTASSWQAAYPPTNGVDRLPGTFWVSGRGPTNHAEWLAVAFPRLAAVSSFQIQPRTENGGYGPAGVQLLLNVSGAIPSSGRPANGEQVFEGILAPDAMLNARLATPIPATNAVLVVTGAYDRGNTNSPRNVQVVELSFFERAQPGSYGDWLLHWFSDGQLANPVITGPDSDPDADGAPNLAEFAVGGNPTMPDAELAALRPWTPAAGGFGFSFRERKIPGGAQRRFERSDDLSIWVETTPTQITNLMEFPDAWLRAAVFPAEKSQAFYRVKFIAPPDL